MSIFAILNLMDALLVKLPNALLARQQLAQIRANLEAMENAGQTINDSHVNRVLDEIKALNASIQSEDPNTHPD